MAIVKQLNKKSGVTYVYESKSYRDKETKQPRSKRKLIGRIDDETGEIIPTHKKAKYVTTSSNSLVDTIPPEGSASYSSLLESLQEKDETIKSLKSEIAELRKERQKLSDELLRLGQKLKR